MTLDDATVAHLTGWAKLQERDGDHPDNVKRLVKLVVAEFDDMDEDEAKYYLETLSWGQICDRFEISY